MKKIFIVLIISIFHSAITYGQQKNFKAFILQGIVNVDTGEIKLDMVGDTTLYPESTRHLTAQIKNGRFEFKSKIPQPLAYTLTIGTNYFSDLIVIAPGGQRIEINIDSIGKLPVIDNQVMREYRKYNATFSVINKKRDSWNKGYSELRNKYPSGIPEPLSVASELKLKSLYNEGDSTLLKYVIRNPGSYLGLWKLVRLTQFGYEKIFDEIMANFADSVKNSYSGKELINILKNSEILSVGNKFPQMELLNVNGNKSKGLQPEKNKYTLVDFWYTGCQPCIAGFPSLVAIYDTYHSQGFEITGISTDQLRYKSDIPLVIKKHKLGWVHYWDINGKGAKQLSIQAFPTNFLLDAKGYIIQKNISSPELNAFLKKNL